MSRVRVGRVNWGRRRQDVNAGGWDEGDVLHTVHGVHILKRRFTRNAWQLNWQIWCVD